MDNLIEKVITAHGGMTRYHELEKAIVTMVSGGLLLDVHNIPQDDTPRDMTVWLHQQHSSLRPVGAPDQFSDFTSNRIAVENDAGKVLLERNGSPAELHEPMKHGAWDGLARATFSGYAMWTYLTTPFFLAMPGFIAEEVESWVEGNETWRVLKVTFPETVLSHSRVQYLYFGPDLLLRRHDYSVDVAGIFDAAQYVYDLVEVNGIKLPLKRRAYKKTADGKPIKEELMVWIDLSNVRYL